MSKLENHVNAKNGAFLCLLNLSIWRIGFPLIGSAISDIPGLVVGGILGIMCHVMVSPYISVNPFKVKQIDDQSQFVRLKGWMVPKGSRTMDAAGYSHIEKNASEQSKIQLKELAATNGHITYLDYANAELLDEQLWDRIEENLRNEEAEKSFSTK